MRKNTPSVSSPSIGGNDCIPGLKVAANAATGDHSPAPSSKLVAGFTGSREGMTRDQQKSFATWLSSLPRGDLHHGDCVGSDEQAHHMARALRWRIVLHPGLGPMALRAFCTGYDAICPAKPNLDRNADIVDVATLLACAPAGPETQRSGTWSTIRKARRKGLPIYLFWPDGGYTTENTPFAKREAMVPHAAQTVAKPSGTNPNPPTSEAG